MRNAEASLLPLVGEDEEEDDGGGGDGSSHINLLPDELLLLIFNKLVDARCLCRCNLVCKRFSTIIPQIHSVSLTIPPRYSISNPNHSQHDGSNNLPKKFVGFLLDSIFFRPFRFVQVTIASKCLPRQFNGPLFRAAVESLKKFRYIRRLRIQIPPVQRQDSLCKWQAEFGNDRNICVILFASSLRKMEDSHEGEGEGGRESHNHEEAGADNSEMFALTDQLLRRRIASANQCFSEASWRNHILRHVVEDHRMLEIAEITDSNGDGSLCAKEKHLADLLDPDLKLPNSGYAKVWHFQELQFPLVGYVMEGLSIFAIRHTDELPEADEERLNSLMDGAFQGSDDIVYREILMRRYDNDVIPITLNLNVRQ